MLAYYLYITNDNGHFVGREVVMASADDDAIGRADALRRGNAAELWLQARPVRIFGRSTRRDDVVRAAPGRRS